MTIARDLEKLVVQNVMGKRAYLYANNDQPVCPLAANTYKTGKHGSAKTTLLLKEFFTNRKYEDIVDSDHDFTSMFEHPHYELKSGFVNSLSPELKILTESYEEIELPLPENLDILLGDELFIHSFVIKQKTYYKIKNLIRGNEVINVS